MNLRAETIGNPLGDYLRGMIPRILAFGASNSSTSINAQLATWAAQQLDAEVSVADLNDFEMPIYSQDRETAGGIPELASKFKALIQGCDGIVVSFAEHNGSYTAAFKNIHDWCSRLGGKMWENKPMFLLATSPGGRGGQTVLASATAVYPHQGGQVAATFSLPAFGDNFENGISNDELLASFKLALGSFENALQQPA